jgi:hypothetical protein
MVTTITVRVELSPEALDAPRRPVAGSGGFQSLLRTLQRGVSDEKVLVLTPELDERIARYVQSYGGGGFQGRLDAVLAELTALARTLEPMAA